MQVIKRDGRLVEFNKERIVKAITLAMAQTQGVLMLSWQIKLLIQLKNN